MWVQNRQFSKIIRWNLRNIISKNDSLELIVNNKGKEEKLILPFVWLRDHCSSPKYYYAPTNQRKSDCTDLFSNILVNDTKQITINDESLINIHWNDGHNSQFDIKSLIDKSQKKKTPRINEFLNIWNSTLNEIPSLHSESLKYEDFAEKLVKYGVVVINGVGETAEATEKLCQSLIPVHDTFFGQFWVFSNDASEDEPAYEDTAYGTDEIGPHTDGTYFNQTPGIQVFHCLQPAKTGGDTVLVDAFNCVEQLKKQDMKAYEILTTMKISHHYLEGTPPGSSIQCVSAEKPVIELDTNGNIQQIRFNPYDRAPFSCLSTSDSELSASKAIQFYQAYQKFARICHDPSNAVNISLRPGSVIFIDNFRVLHSRTSFQGYRRMCGCYLSRDNFYAKSRPYLPSNIQQFI